jgi:hypothetical protein
MANQAKGLTLNLGDSIQTKSLPFAGAGIDASQFAEIGVGGISMAAVPQRLPVLGATVRRLPRHSATNKFSPDTPAGVQPRRTVEQYSFRSPCCLT